MDKALELLLMLDIELSDIIVVYLDGLTLTGNISDIYQYISFKHKRNKR